jgi:hypothetical protein
MNNTVVEWAVVSGNTAIISSEVGEFWSLRLDGCESSLPFCQAMTSKGTRCSTATLLDGAVELGFGHDGGDSKSPAASLPRYIFDLVGAYHNSSRTPGYFRKAAKRFMQLDRPDIASYLETHAREETGHDRLALKDLRALGLPAEHLVANLFPQGARVLCEFFDCISSADYPVGCIGYSYCFESTASMKQKSDVEALAALCPEGVDACRFLRTHSSLGNEVGHVEDMIDFISGLPASDRTEIVRATYDTAVMMAQGLRRKNDMSDAVILAEIQAAIG